jgi:alanyl-tRNA synthetase
VREIAGIKVLVSRMDGVDAKSMRDAVDRAKDKLQNAIVVFASVDDGKVRLAAGVTKNNTDKIKAGDLIRPVAEQVGGKGGGRPDFAQAGGNDPSKLDQALNSVPDWVAEKLS